MELLFQKEKYDKPKNTSGSRDIMKSCLTALYIILGSKNLGVPTNFAQKIPIIEKDRTIDEVKEKYDIEIVFSEHSETGEIRYGPAKNANEHAKIIQNVLSQYSPMLLKMSGVNKIVLTENLKYHDDKKCRRKEKCTLKKCHHLSRINGIQNTQEHIFYVNTIPDVKDMPVEAYISRVSHHELYHTIDDILLPEDEDKLFWAKENRRGKKEYVGKKWRKAEKEAGSKGILLGFAEPYGVSTIYEDKATINAHLRVPYYSKKLFRQCRYDTILKKKVEKLTGCQLNTKTGKFEKTYTEKEYVKLFGCEKILYFGEWGKGDGTNITMDHVYWNEIIESGKAKVRPINILPEVLGNSFYNEKFLRADIDVRAILDNVQFKNLENSGIPRLEPLYPKRLVPKISIQ